MKITTQERIQGKGKSTLMLRSPENILSLYVQSAFILHFDICYVMRFIAVQVCSSLPFSASAHTVLETALETLLL